jgi:glycosyltransferase involved in cell wall biosynthesis
LDKKLQLAQFIASRGHGGAEKVFIDLCNNLSKKHAVTAYTYDNPFIINALNESIEICIIEQKSRYHLPSYFRIYHLLKERPHDLIHTHSAKASFLIYYLNKLLRIPHLATKHNSRKGKTFNKIKHVSAVSKRVSKTISHPSTIIYNGIYPQSISPRKKSNTVFKLLSIGRLDPIKGFDSLIREVSKLQIDYQLDIVGDGPQKRELEALIKVLKLEGNVRLLGYQSNIPEKMTESDIVIINSLSEGFSIVALEALYYSKVLISTKVGVIDEILDENFIFEPDKLAEKIEAIHKEYENYQQMFDQIRQQKKTSFLFSKSVDAYESAYFKLLK